MALDAVSFFFWYHENEYFQACRNYFRNRVGGGSWFTPIPQPIPKLLFINQEAGVNSRIGKQLKPFYQQALKMLGALKSKIV
jgi:hypothetical protein